MRINKLLAVLAAFLLLVAACGSDDGIDLVAANPVEDTESTDDSADSGDDAEAPDDSAEPIDEPPIDESDPLDETSDDLPILGGGGTLATVEVTVTSPDEADVVYTISCLGDTATIIGDVGLDAFAACAQLGDETVRDLLINGPDLERVCSQIDGGPDVATIVGTYDGVDGPVVDVSINRRNGCTIDEWDVMLSAVLPAAGLGF